MDGLECSEVLFSEIKNDNEKYRFDSEFFQKKFLMAYDIIKSQPYSTIENEYSCLTLTSPKIYTSIIKTGYTTCSFIFSTKL